MSKTIQAVFGLPEVGLQDCSKIYKKTDDLEVIDSEVAVGIEVEVENHALTHHPADRVWMLKGDGSLRNSGVEYVTVPIHASYAPAALKDLLSESLAQECCFSPRTSIHVHMDASKKETNQVVDIILLYTLFEELFYQYAGRGRIKNIYCVPIFDTSLLKMAATSNRSLVNVVDVWSKYSGLNICRLRDLGTLEFRHMHGTFDDRKISVWIRLLTKLYAYAEKVGTEFIRKLCMEGGDYGEVLYTMFGLDMRYLKYSSPKDIQRGIDAVKIAFATYRTVSVFRDNAQQKIGAYFNTKRVK